MKKIFIGLISILLILIPQTTNAATLQNYKDKLNQFIKENDDNNAAINQTQGQITASNKEIQNIKSEINKMTQEIEQMKLDSIEYGNEIKDKQIESKEILAYYQIADDKNLYLEYAFGAETITDLIYRTAVVEQLIQYNSKKVDELNQMIENNKKREQQLKVKEEEMNKRQQVLTKKVSDLTGVKASLNENSVDIKKQIEIYRALVKSYEAAGCKANDVIGVDCARGNNVGEWKRPIDNGYVTSEFGYRWGSLHRAVDVSNKNPYSTKIYPAANGTITAKYYDAYGALTLVIEHKTVNGKYYSSLYTHMSQYAPNLYVGKSVKSTDYIGYMGATGYATGPHLHFELAPCRLFNQYDSNCSSWNRYTNYMAQIYKNGSWKGPRQLINFPNPYVFFNSR